MARGQIVEDIEPSRTRSSATRFADDEESTNSA
jgi:hypothetical protein